MTITWLTAARPGEGGPNCLQTRRAQTEEEEKCVGCWAILLGDETIPGVVCVQPKQSSQFNSAAQEFRGTMATGPHMYLLSAKASSVHAALSWSLPADHWVRCT